MSHKIAAKFDEEEEIHTERPKLIYSVISNVADDRTEVTILLLVGDR